MTLHPLHISPRGLARGFTLVEMLFVCIVVGVLLAVAAPVGISVLQASGMNRATSMISDELNMARQLAMTRNREVEVRFYKVATDATTQDLQFRAFRSFLVEGDSPENVKALGNVQYLPESIIISADTKNSTLLDYGNPNRSGLMLFQETLPGTSSPVDCVSFIFRPNGGTNLGPIDPPEGNWYLTFHQAHAVVNVETGIPDNFCTVQIDPVSGRVRVYRP
ncbi:MAG TPA: Verru_Chthon cassette protein D [Verrucomicrobium sp.]|nr:Verru_Chthon cassette protein D [Verrucomicrobium sp.]